MKKITATILTVLILAVSLLPLTAFAWNDPELMLNASYNADKKTITVEYRVLEFAGTESADFRLRFDPKVVELVDYEETKMSNVIMEIGKMEGYDNTLAIQFVDLYYVEEEDCEEDNSATVVTFNFKVINESATETVFISYADSYNMDPDSIEKSPERATLKIPLNEGSVSKSTVEGYIPSDNTSDNKDITKVIVAAVIAAVVLIGGTVAIVIKYRKK